MTKENKRLLANKTDVQNKIGVQDKIAFIPIIIILGIIPLIVRLKVQEIAQEDMSYALAAIFTDTFSYWKAVGIIVIAILMGIYIFLVFKKKDVKLSKTVKICMMALLIFMLATLVSAMLSQYKNIAWWGQYGRREGFFTILSYCVIFLYSLYFYKRSMDIKYILIPLSALVILEGILIFSEVIGKNILLSKFIGFIMIPAEYRGMANALPVDSGGKASGTLYNPNYVGSFVALLLPIFVSLILKLKPIKKRILYGGIALILAISLFASGSRAGILGIGISLIICLIFFGKNLIKLSKKFIVGVLITSVALLCISSISGGGIAKNMTSIAKDANSLFDKTKTDILLNSPIKDMHSEGNEFIIMFADEKKLNISIDDNDQLKILNENKKRVESISVDGKYIALNEKLPLDIRFQIGNMTDGDLSQRVYLLKIDEKPWFALTKGNNGIITLDKYGNYITIEPAEHIGFEGKERIGSNRGYIWSRSLPVFRDNLIFGVGPDAFIAAFPHGDVLARWSLYGTANIIVDKPHNLYLQIGINQGIIALIAFLVLNGAYIVNSFKVYFKRKEYTFHDMFGIGIMLGIVGYLGAGMFNDSVVSVAPLYWCLLGIGFAVNYINENELEEYQCK